MMISIELMMLELVSENEIAIWYGDEYDREIADIIAPTKVAVEGWLVENFGAEKVPSDYFLHQDLKIRSIWGHLDLCRLVDRAIDAHNEKGNA